MPLYVVLAPALPRRLGAAAGIRTVVFNSLAVVLVVFVPIVVILELERKSAVRCAAFVGAVVFIHVLPGARVSLCV